MRLTQGFLANRLPKRVSNRINKQLSKRLFIRVYTRLFTLTFAIICTSHNAAAAVKNEGEYSPEFSPNGEYIAYHANSAEHFFDVFVKHIATGKTHNITQNQAYDTDASWSPNSQKLVFSSSQSGQWDIYLYDIKSKASSLLITDPSMDNQPIWSPDGKSIAFLSRREGNSQIYIYDMHSKQQKRLSHTEHAIFHPNWSEDGRSIVFDQNIDGKSSIYQLNVASGHSEKLYEGTGSSIAAELRHNKLYVTTKPAQGWDIIAVDLISKKITNLAVTPADEMKANIDLKRKRMVYSKTDSAGIPKLEIQSLK
jgi:TolB protein